MTDNEGKTPDTVEQPNEQKTTGKTPIDSLPPDIQSYIDELREENKKWRIEKKKADDTARKATEERLVEQNEWKQLAEQRATRLAELESVAAKAETIEAAFNATLEARLKNIPSDIKKRTVDPIRESLSPLAFAHWLDANQDLLTARRAPNLDAGAQGNPTESPIKVTSEQLEMAKRAGMTPAQYQAALQKTQTRPTE